MIVSRLTGLVEGLAVNFTRTSDEYRLVDGVDVSAYYDAVLCITGRYHRSTPRGPVRLAYGSFPLDEYILVCPD